VLAGGWKGRSQSHGPGSGSAIAAVQSAGSRDFICSLARRGTAISLIELQQG
jgi:hypothetical protein